MFYLSNISWDVLEMLQQRKFWQLFDGGVASCEVKLTKPDLRIYHALLAKYGLSAAESIFIDDNTANASAAFDADITGDPLQKCAYAAARAAELRRGKRKKTEQAETGCHGCRGIAALPTQTNPKRAPEHFVPGRVFAAVPPPPGSQLFFDSLQRVFSRRLTCAWLIPISPATSTCVLPAK